MTGPLLSGRSRRMAERHQQLWVHQTCERPAGHANRRGAAFPRMTPEVVPIGPPPFGPAPCGCSPVPRCFRHEDGRPRTAGPQMPVHRGGGLRRKPGRRCYRVLAGGASAEGTPASPVVGRGLPGSAPVAGVRAARRSCRRPWRNWYTGPTVRRTPRLRASSRNRIRRTGVRSDTASWANAREDDHDWGYTTPASEAGPRPGQRACHEWRPCHGLEREHQPRTQPDSEPDHQSGHQPERLIAVP